MRGAIGLGYVDRLRINLEDAMAKGQMRSNKEKKKPKQDKNKPKSLEIKPATSYASQYGKKH